MASSVAQFVVSLGSDGRILSQGSVKSALVKDAALAAEVDKEEEVLEKAEGTIDTAEPTAEGGKQADGKLIVAEEVAEGHVSWDARKLSPLLFRLWLSRLKVKLYLSGMSGKRFAVFWFSVVLGLTLSHVADSVQTWWLGYWAAQYNGRDPMEVSVP